MLMFHEFYKRRGNNSVVGKDCYHEFVLKKLYDGVGIIVGYMNEDSEERVRVLAEAARRMESELKELRQSTYKDKSQVQSKLEKLAHQNNELLAKEQALEEAIEDLKLQKEAIEKSHLSEITRERSDYSRSVQDLRNRLA
jgi:chromosome segregation ATPase